MLISIRANGEMKAGAERILLDDYLIRANGLARAAGFLGVQELPYKPRGQTSQQERIQELIQPCAKADMVIVLDERGVDIRSQDIAMQFANWRNDGLGQIIFLIGDADGFGAAGGAGLAIAREKRVLWRFGTQTWPHKMVRVMAAEQIYRALSILQNTPYHRE